MAKTKQLSRKRLSKTEEQKLREELSQSNSLAQNQAREIEILNQRLEVACSNSSRLQGELLEANDKIDDLDNKTEDLKLEVASLNEQLASQRERTAEKAGYAAGSTEAMSTVLGPIISTMCEKLGNNSGDNGHFRGRAPRNPLDALLALLNANRPVGAPSFEEFMAQMGGG